MSSHFAVPYQGELPPPLPVPPLQQTLQRYLHAVKAVVKKDKYEATEKIVAKFGEPGGEGEYLQKKLTEIAATKDNWVYEWWLDDMYMKNRSALPINSNPCMVFPNQQYKGMNDLLRLAAHFVNGILDYKFSLAKEELPLDTIKDQPLCMAQYYRLLTTCRVPGPGRDYQLSSENAGKYDNEHILIIYKRIFFAIDVVVNQERVPEYEILASLKQVVQMASEDSGCGEQIGLMTADQRDRWARARSRMLEEIFVTMNMSQMNMLCHEPDDLIQEHAHKTNRESLQIVESSLFVICIDSPLPVSFNHRLNYAATKKKIRDDVNKASQMLFGGGSKFNAGNRWFDQTLQIVLSTDGVCGLCYEHSPAEGIVVIQLMEKLIQSYSQQANQSIATKSESCVLENQPRKLPWKVTNDIKEAINKAAHSLDKSGEDLDFYVLRFREYGRNFPKENKTSPDAFIQLALQLTFYKLHRKLVSTYESASTRRFRLGRVDNIRAATPEALTWCRAMCGDDEIDDIDKMTFFNEAMRVQSEIMNYNIMGQGIDNHLLGLRELSADIGRPTPAIFKDDTYKISQHFALSTSQVPTVTDSFMGYGPVVANGYGASYNPHENGIVFCIASFLSDDDTSSEMFAMSLESTLLQMKELIEKRNSGALMNGRAAELK